MHHPVGELDLIDEIGGTVDGILGRVINIIQSMQNILNYPVISVQGEGALEHDRSPHHERAPDLLVWLVPEINVTGSSQSATVGTGFACRTADINITASPAECHVVNDPSARRGLFHPAHQVHQDRFSSAASADNSQDLPFGNLKRDVL
jgi:hypothetical protein